MNELLLYPGNNQYVRFVGTEDRPEWVAQDVADVLGIKNASNTLRYMPDDE